METSNEPFTKPYKDHENFLKWESDYQTAKDVVEYDKSLWSRDENRPKTLLCHDMRGGYLQDRFDQGYPSTDCYSFYHWHLVDVFCYFSHHFVTIPPVQWINAAHKNGVKMIGTIITEWDEGRKNLQKVLKSKEAVEVFVKCLVGIATKMKFEGWLVNIECHVEDQEMDQLVYLVKHLTDEMHKSNNDAQVIWYDSVIKSGQLRWQNKLCAENRLFFDVCDGIFLNYNWSPIHLTESLAQAKQRKHDVYVGVDIFGRGCPGGGGWNTNKALKMIREHDLSAAIFAFGWVYEKLGESVYHINNEMFWELLSDDLYPHYINRLPMVTTFNRGYGHSLFKNGKKISNRPISNLSLTDMQPTFPTNRYQVISGCPIITELAYKTDDAYNGNGCLFFSGTFEDAEQTNDVMFRLFKTDLRLTKKEASQFTVLLTYKNNYEYHAQPKLVLCCREGDKMVLDSYDTISVQSEWQIQEHRHKLNQDIHIKEIQLHLQSTNNERGRFQFLLGEFKIIDASKRNLDAEKPPTNQLTIEPPTTQLTIEPPTTQLTIEHKALNKNANDENIEIEIQLSWQVDENARSYDIFCLNATAYCTIQDIAGKTHEIDSSKTDFFIGRAFASHYQIGHFLIKKNSSPRGELKFQIYSNDGNGDTKLYCENIIGIDQLLL